MRDPEQHLRLAVCQAHGPVALIRIRYREAYGAERWSTAGRARALIVVMQPPDRPSRLRSALAECLFRILFGSLGTFGRMQCFNPHIVEENEMRKFGYVLAALGAIAIAAPSIASAETTIIKRGDRDHFGPRAEFRGHRDFGWREGWRHRHGDKTVIIKRGHHEY
jgi:hypothetical protein